MPGDLKVEKIEKGQPSPIDGYVLPPGAMAEIGPCLSEALRKRELTNPVWRKTEARDPFGPTGLDQ